MLPDNIREFGDASKAREWIYDNALTSVAKRFPIEDNDYQLNLINPRYDGPKDFSLPQQKEALIKLRQLYTPIKGTWQLVHKPSGSVIEEKDDTVMQVPYLTDRGTFIRHGNEISGHSQSRLKPGPYSRVAKSGIVETFYNIAPGTGKNFRVEMEPKTGIFKFNIGQASLPLYPILKSIGVNDQQLIKMWGPQITEANAQARAVNIIDKLYARMAGTKATYTNINDKINYIKEEFPKYKLDPWVVARNLGLNNTEGVTPDVLLRSTNKLLSISRGEEEPDDRDAPVYSNILSYEDLIKERIDKDAGKLARNLFFKIKRDKSLKRIPFSALNPYVESYLQGSRLTQPLEETNPLHTWEQQHRIVKLGEGGISSAEAVTESARNVNTGQAGFIDGIAGPECVDSFTQVFTSKGWINFSDANVNTLFACKNNDKLIFSKADRLISEHYKGKLYGVKTKFIDYLVTPNHRCFVRPANWKLPFRIETADKVYGKARNFITSPGVYESSIIIDSFTIPPALSKRSKEGYGREPVNLKTISAELWAEFLGYYLSEGCVNRVGTVLKGISISQSKNINPIKYEKIKHCIEQFDRAFTKSETGFTISCTQLGQYFDQFGYSADKFLPDYVFNFSIKVRSILLEALLLGDGRINKSHTSYCTCSSRLADDVERLAISLGFSVSRHVELDKRYNPAFIMYIVSLLKFEERTIQDRSKHYIVDYDGMVYCATVPGGLLYIRRGAGIGHWSGNSSSVGIDVRAAYKTFKGRDQQMHAEFRNARTNRLELLRPEDSDDKTIAFPSQDLSKPNQEITAIRRGKIVQVPAKEIDYQIPSRAHMFSTGTNSGIASTGMMPGRLFYSAKYWSQFMPQVKGEVPLVDTLVPDQSDITFLEHYGRKIGTLSSPIDGKVIKVNDDVVIVQNKDGEKRKIELVKDFPFNRLTGISYYPTVKVGDGVIKGGMLAHSNFTDSKSGSINMGVNLKTAIIPYRGHSIEDAHVISESAAKRLATSRLYGYDETAKHGINIDKNRFISLFSNQFTKEQVDKIDDNGIVRPGTTLQKGDPIILATGPKLLSPEDVKLGKLHKALRAAYTNKAQTWDYDYPGIVTDSALSGKSAVVNIKAEAPVQVGDKIVTRESLKGVVSQIVPDDKMPQDAVTGQPYDILLNPMGVLSRVAPNQLVELQLSKIAKKLGKQMRIPENAPEEGWNVWTLNKLKEHGLNESATLYDPDSKKYIPNIGDGYAYISAFHHLAEKKLSGRGAGAGSYTSAEQPAHGGFEGGHAKRFGTLDLNAALSHSATEVIRDVINVRGTKNEDYWKALKMGRPLPEPTVPFIYNKFINLLKAGGVNIREKGDTLSLLPMTDDDMKELSKGDITSSNMVDKNFEPVAGGLFDMGKTGGLSGAHWSTIKLNEPMPNPVFEEPIRRLLGLREKDLYNILGGIQQLDGKTGGMAIKDALSKLDIDKELIKNKEAVTELRGANRDNAIKLIGYLTAIKKQGLHPSVWMLNKIPVIPPVFRPISQLGDVTIQSDINELYRDIIETNKNIGELRKDLPESGLLEEKSRLYDSVKAAFGLGDPITREGASKGLKGAIKQIIGTSPKTGLFQHKVISKPVDVVARGVIAPDPNLDMDSIGIPEDMAWTTYAPFIMRRMVQHGYPADAVLQMIKDKHRIAESALEEEMSSRPVIVDRAPVWHKFNLMAFYPHIVKDKVIRISPLIAKGFNADFDGDSMNFHVPVSDKAVAQAKFKMLPSRNLISLTDLRSVQHTPLQELALGLYTLTRNISDKKPMVFNTTNEAKLAYRQGKIKANDPIEILELKNKRSL